MTETRQAEVNIGTIGHVDHGKTSIVKALTGEWVEKHSEELKRGITIRLGYADFDVYHCDKCKEYCLQNTCDKKHTTKFVRKISFVDCPGHENLMAVTISGTALMDGALLVIAANEKCPQPQTQEHLHALDVVKVSNIVIAQNKVDLVTREQALENYKQIKEFVKGTVAENSPIIPVSANNKLNIQYLLEAIEKMVPTPQRDLTKPAKMYIARSFDVNKPGTEIEKLRGGVIGGSIIEGELKIGDKIEIKPGIEKNGEYASIETEIISLSTKDGSLEKAGAGGLIGIGTKLDPSVTKNDKMIGNIAGDLKALPRSTNKIKFEMHKFTRIVTDEQLDLKMNDVIVANAGTAMSPGTVVYAADNKFEIILKRPFCVNKGDKIAISKRSKNRWALMGYGEII